MSVEYDVTAFFFCGTLDYVEVISYGIAVSVSCKNLMTQKGQYKFIGCKACGIAVACNTDNFLFKFQVSENETV